MTEKSTLPAIPWSAKDGFLIIMLIDLIQEKDNYIILFGKKDTKENTSGDTKIMVYSRIAQKMFPETFEKHGKTLAKRVKAKVDELCGKYKEKAALLRQTGGGVGAPEDVESGGVHHYLDYYIPHDGPHHDTPDAAKNIWQQINKDFPYFAALHEFLSTRPNIVPPIITTGTGPHGRQVVHNQPPKAPTQARGFDESTINPFLMNRVATPPPPSTSQINISDDSDSSPLRLLSTNNRIRDQQTPQMYKSGGTAPKSVKGPKASTFGLELTNAVEKARGNLMHIPKKRTLEDAIIESSRENIAILRERAAAQAEHRRQSLLISQKAQLIELHKLGVYDKEELKQKLAELDTPPVPLTPHTPLRISHTASTPGTSFTRSSSRIQSLSPTHRGSPTRWEIENSQQSLPFETSDI